MEFEPLLPNVDPHSTSSTPPSGKLPRPVFETVFAFAPNRETMGGTAYLICEDTGNILVDCPAWDGEQEALIQQHGPVRWLVLTHRGAIARVKPIQQALGCDVLIHEQEAYLLPGLAVTSFRESFELSRLSRLIWTPGHSPGSACLYHAAYGGVLFTGRHLLPNQQGDPMPLRIAKTFHWPRQIRSVEQLRYQFSPETLHYICPGANTGFLRGERAIAHAYEKLARLDLPELLKAKPLI